MIFLTSVDKGNPSMKHTSLYDKEAYKLEVVQSVNRPGQKAHLIPLQEGIGSGYQKIV